MNEDPETALPKAYLAGPEVFLEHAVDVGIRKKALCRKYGLEGLFPFDNEIKSVSENDRIDRAIYRANVAMMKAADCIIVNLTPFRGPSADVGSVFELGLMVGLGKPVFGYTNVKDDLSTRMRKSGLLDPDARGARPKDRGGLFVEDFGNRDNLMIDACFAAQGTAFVAIEAAHGNVFEDLSGFEICLKLASERIGS